MYGTVRNILQASITKENGSDVWKGVSQRAGLVLELGLAAGTQWLAETFQLRSGIRCNVSVEGETRAVGRDLEMAVFHMILARLMNVERHARATQVDIRFEMREDVLLLRIEDDGVDGSPTLCVSIPLQASSVPRNDSPSATPITSI